MKVDTIIKNYEAAERKRTEKQAAIDRFTAQLAELKQQQEAALVAGDRAAYKKVSAEIEEMVLDLNIAKHQAIINPITPEDLASAWTEYRNGFNRELAKKVDRLQKARQATKDAYEDLLHYENGALQDRERLAGIAHVDPATLELDLLPDDAVPVPQMTLKSPEARYLAASGSWPVNVVSGDAISDAYSITNGRPVENPHF